jgi:hypothetical protein
MAGVSGAESGAVSGVGAKRAGFVSRPGFDEFRQVLKTLRTTLPAAKPVIVRTSRVWPGLAWSLRQEAPQVRHHAEQGFAGGPGNRDPAARMAHTLAWNYALDSLATKPMLEPGEFERACHDEAWGCAYSRVWRAYLDVIRDAA